MIRHAFAAFLGLSLGLISIHTHAAQETIDVVGCYQDSDGDGLGDPEVPIACDSDEAVTNDLDCNDDDPLITILGWYSDEDGDGFGDVSAVGIIQCDPPPATSMDNSDCDDSRDWIFPGAVEIPGDGIDQDCDGVDLSLEVFKNGFEEESSSD